MKRLRVISSLCFVLLATYGAGDQKSSLGNVVSETLLRQLLPELKNPQVMTLRDLTSDDARHAFKFYKYSFSLTGDFNHDNVPDLAVAGRFENDRDPEDQAFVAIFSNRNGRWTREFFLRPRSRTVVLILDKHPDPNKARQGYPSIVASFTVLGSDDYAVIYWDGKSYQTLSGFDIVAEESDKAFEKRKKSK